MEETLAFYGSEVKALGGGRVGGYLVLFSTEQDPDLQADYFTKSTDFFVNDGDVRPVLYRHGLHPVIKSRKLGKGTLKFDDVGVFIEAELELRDSYEKAIYKLAEMGKLGWSSGSMGHLVNRVPKQKAFELETWPIGEASLTPNPVEARTSATPIKSLADEEIDLDEFVKSLEVKEEEIKEFSLAGIPAIHTFCEDVSPSSFKQGSQRSESAVAAVKEFITIGGILGEAFHSHKSRLVRHTENRFVKDGRPVSSADAESIQQALKDIDRLEQVFSTIKQDLRGLEQLSNMAKVKRDALSEAARLEVWNFHRISGLKPEGVS